MFCGGATTCAYLLLILAVTTAPDRSCTLEHPGVCVLAVPDNHDRHLPNCLSLKWVQEVCRRYMQTCAMPMTSPEMGSPRIIMQP